MKRSAKEVIDSILKNLMMACEAKHAACGKALSEAVANPTTASAVKSAGLQGAAQAYLEAVRLIATEAADILNDKPERVRYLSDGTPVEIVGPFQPPK